MSQQESAQERSELPTPRRREQAMADGRVPKSPELTAAAGLLAAALGLTMAGGKAATHESVSVLRDSFGRLSAEPLTMPGAAAIVRDVLFSGLRAAAPVLLAVGAVILLVAGVQARGVWSGKPMAPDLSRISPLAGFKRMFSTQSVFNLVKAILKLVVLGALTWSALHGAWGDLSGLGGEAAGTVLGVARDLILRLVFSVGIGFLAVAALDYGVAVWQHEQQLKMTRQEIVQEHRESEGDPLLKSRIQSLARALSRKRMLHKVKEADVVVANPSHLAIALRYDPLNDGAPIVLALGRRKLALKIKELAAKAGVPVVENKPLARALIATATVGKPIPPALYAAVAEVLAWVYKRRGSGPAKLLAGAKR